MENVDIKSTSWEEVSEHLNLPFGSGLNRDQCAAVSLMRFDKNKDNPLVQALEYFIRYTLCVELSDVMSWYIEANTEDEKPFTLLLRDDRHITGNIVQTWRVREFTEKATLKG